MKSWKSKKYQILKDFQKIAFCRLVYLHEILSIFIKSPDFNEIKEISDFKQIFKREPSTVWCTCIIKSPDFNVLVQIMIFPTKAFNAGDQ